MKNPRVEINVSEKVKKMVEPGSCTPNYIQEK